MYHQGIPIFKDINTSQICIHYMLKKVYVSVQDKILNQIVNTCVNCSPFFHK